MEHEKIQDAKPKLNHTWYEDALIYHMFTFSAANAPFKNDYSVTEHRFAEIEKWIPHIKGMGFNAVLFSPLLKSISHGYDVTDYFEIDNRLGIKDEFRVLVNRFHDNGIRVILDSVFNHCGRDFFAFRELQRNNREYEHWFSGVDFSKQSPLGDSFTYDTWSGHYSLPKFNLTNAAVRNYLLDAVRFWIDFFGIDGMRLDAANVLDWSFMEELRGLTGKLKPDFWLMGEVVSGDYSKWVNGKLLHSVTNYILYKGLFSSHNENNLFELAYSVKNSVPDNGLPLYTFLDNHDQSRIASNVTNPEHLRTLYALLFTLPGIPSVYYGSEWGVTGVKENNSDGPLRPYIDIEKRSEYSTWLTGYIHTLMGIRQASNALKYGQYRQIFLDYNRPFVFERSCDNERVFVAVNIGDRDDFIRLNMHVRGKLRDLLSGELIPAPGRIQIRAHTARIITQL